MYNLPNTHKPTGQNGSRTQIIQQFLTDSGLPTLNDDDSQQLEDPITEEELILAFKSLKSGKSPGPDGFTTHYYKAFSTSLVPYLLKTFNYLKDPREIA